MRPTSAVRAVPGGGGAAPLPAPLLRPRAGGARLLVDGVAGVRGRGPGAGEARHRPGRAERVGEPEPRAEAEVGRLRLDRADQPGLAAEEMRAAGDVEHQRRALLGDPGRLKRPAQRRSAGQERGRCGLRPRGG